MTSSISYLLLAVFSKGLFNKSLCSLVFLVKAPENNHLSQLHPCSLPRAVAALMERFEVCRVPFGGAARSQQTSRSARSGTFAAAGALAIAAASPWFECSLLVRRSACIDALLFPSG